MISLLIFFTLSSSLLAQDERFFRKIYSDDLTKKKSTQETYQTYHWRVRSKFHEFDLNDDGESEGIVLEKKDQENWIHFFSRTGKKLNSFRVETKGVGAQLYRVNVRALSPKTKVLVLHFYEGATEHLDFEGTSRFYFVTIDNKDFQTLSMFKGPIFWHEKKEGKKHFHEREYLLNVTDLNLDGTKEIVVSYHTIRKVYKYNSKGKWISL